MRHLLWKAAGFTLLMVTLTVSVYLAAYFVAVNDRTFIIVATASPGSLDDADVILPTYRFGGKIRSHFLAWPINSIGRFERSFGNPKPFNV